MSVPRNNPVAVFDSGVGGLSVLRHLCQRLPHERILYLADQAHVPYGPRPDAEVRHFAQEITRFFLKQRVKLIVVACNRASAAALDDLRATFPALPFVGMEPAVKPAAAQTRSGKIGVLATAGTFESRRYANLRDRFARQITVLEDSCAGLVPLIERGQLATPETATLVTRVVAPMLDAGADTLVLGCTHYPFVRAAIEAAVQALTDREVSIIDPAPAVARQAGRVLLAHDLHAADAAPGTIEAFTTGDPEKFAALARQLLGYPLPATPLCWHDGRLRFLPDARPTRSRAHTV